MGNAQTPCCAHMPHPACPFPAPCCPAGAQHKPLIPSQPHSTHTSSQKEPGRTGLPTPLGPKGGMLSLEGALQADAHGILVPKAAAGHCAAWLLSAGCSHSSTPPRAASQPPHCTGHQHCTDVGRALGLGAAQHLRGNDALQNCWHGAPQCVSRTGPCVLLCAAGMGYAAGGARSPGNRISLTKHWNINKGWLCNEQCLNPGLWKSGSRFQCSVGEG